MLLIVSNYKVVVVYLFQPTTPNAYQRINICLLYKNSPKRLRFFPSLAICQNFKALDAAASSHAQQLFNIKN
jgi:hypothetical protein